MLVERSRIMDASGGNPPALSEMKRVHVPLHTHIPEKVWLMVMGDTRGKTKLNVMNTVRGKQWCKKKQETRYP